MRECKDAHLVLQYGNFEPHYRRIVNTTREIPGMQTVRANMPHTSIFKLFNLRDEEIEPMRQTAREATMALRGSRVAVTGLGIASGYGRNFIFLKVRPECDLGGVRQEVKDLLTGYRRIEEVRPLHISLGYIPARRSGELYGSRRRVIEHLVATLDSLVITKASIFVKQRNTFHDKH